MAQEIFMPRMGVTMESGTIVRWLKRVGDPVRKGEPLMEIETDKVQLEVTSDVEGILLSIEVPEGQEVPVGTVLAWVGAPGETVPRGGGAGTPEPAVATPAAAPAAPAAGVQRAPVAPPPAPDGRVRATPAARARARRYGVDLEAVQGTGPAGRIQLRDVEAAAGRPTTPTGPTSPARRYRDVPVTGMRKVIAERLARSFHGTVPVLLTADVALDRAEALRVGVLPLVIRAAALALREHPRLNAHWLDSAIREFDDVHIAVAVALEDGLTAPVIRHADQLGLGEIAARVADLASRARQGALTLGDLEGATFTVSNLGAHPIGFFMPVINPPQVAILGVGQATRRPIVRGGEVVVVPVLPLSLVFDHRAVDGAPAAAFLGSLKALLEEPERLGP